MQYRAAFRSISEHVHAEALRAALDRSLKAGAPPIIRRAPLPSSVKWHGLSTAAAAPSDFWFSKVGHLTPIAVPPLDR